MNDLGSVSLNGLKSEFTYYGMSVKKDIFYDEENNNLFLFSTYGDCDIEGIVNGIKGERYDYLVNTLNNNKNLIIDWFKLEGTTSDYIIYHGLEPELIESSICPELLSMKLEQLKTEGDGFKNWKYQEYKDGKFTQLF